MSRHRIVVVFAAPIPVGHRVEIRWYGRTTRGLFGSTSREERPAEPVILDLDTGIEWVTDHAYLQEDGVKHADQPISLGEAPSGDVTQLLRGTVRACRVVHVRRYSELDVQTELLIETDA